MKAIRFRFLLGPVLFLIPTWLNLLDSYFNLEVLGYSFKKTPMLLWLLTMFITPIIFLLYSSYNSKTIKEKLILAPLLGILILGVNGLFAICLTWCILPVLNGFIELIAHLNR